MKKRNFVALLAIFSVFGLIAQNTVKGKVVNSSSEKPIANVVVTVLGTTISQKTNINGDFVLKNIPEGKQIIKIALSGFETQQYPLNLKRKVVDLDVIRFYKVSQITDDLSVIALSDDELSDDEGGADNTAGLLQSSKDVFTRAAAFNFPWFRVRGYDSQHADVLMNGIKMNKVSNGRPQWSDWGGLNDVLRNQEFANGLAASDKTFGGVLGSIYMNTRASQQRAGSSISASSANRNYSGRVMVSHNTGVSEKGWALSVSASRRYAQEGYLEGSSYNAWSGYISAEKKINDNHSFGITAFHTFNRRGKSSPNTQEVYDLRGTKYNSYWGVQGGKNRNSRMKEISEPMAILSHYWTINDKTSIQTNAAYQTGYISNSRLGHFGVINADPTYYQKLPSYYLSRGDIEGAYNSQQSFINDGQIDWDKLYQANFTVNGNAAYYQYADVNDDTTISANTNLTTELTDNITLNARVNYSQLSSGNYAEMLDLLGAQYFENVSAFDSGDAGQFDLNNPSRLIREGERFNYDYNIESTTTDAFTQLQFSYDKIDFFVAGSYVMTSHQRKGLVRNGLFPGVNESFGKGEKQSFNDMSFKGGITYKITGRHLLNVNAGMLSVAPNLRGTFANARVNNSIVPDLTSQKILSYDASYIYRAPGIKGRLTGYMTNFTDGVETAFYYAEGIGSEGGDDRDFVGEVTTGVAKQNKGIEFGMEVQVTPTIKLTGVTSIANFEYSDNAHLYLTSDNDVFENGFNDLGTTYLKGVKIGGTAQQAYSLGFEYRDPNYWWFGVNGNYVMDNFLNVSRVMRTDNFYKDSDGLPIINPETGNTVTQQEVDDMLTQEEFDGVFLMNAIGGKSWKVGDKYIGFFANISNILGREYKTGGFQQARNANFLQLQEDRANPTQTFGPKYWYGNKTTYYLNLYLRF